MRFKIKASDEARKKAYFELDMKQRDEAAKVIVESGARVGLINLHADLDDREILRILKLFGQATMFVLEESDSTPDQRRQFLQRWEYAGGPGMTDPRNINIYAAFQRALKKKTAPTSIPAKKTCCSSKVKEPTNEEIQLQLDRAKDHAERGGLRGAYPGETPESSVIMMKNYFEGYTQENSVIVHLHCLLEREEWIKNYLADAVYAGDDELQDAEHHGGVYLCPKCHNCQIVQLGTSDESAAVDVLLVICGTCEGPVVALALDGEVPAWDRCHDRKHGYYININRDVLTVECGHCRHELATMKLRERETNDLAATNKVEIN